MIYIGQLILGDFEENTMTFEIEGEMTLKAVKYKIQQVSIENSINKPVFPEDLDEFNKQWEFIDQGIEGKLYARRDRENDKASCYTVNEIFEKLLKGDLDW